MHIECEAHLDIHLTACDMSLCDAICAVGTRYFAHAKRYVRKRTRKMALSGNAITKRTKMDKSKKALKFTLAVLPVVLIGSYFAALMLFGSLNNAEITAAINKFGSKQVLALISTVQPTILTLVCAYFGYIISDKVGLMREFGFEKRKLLIVFAVSLIGGALLSADAWTFAKWIPGLASSYKSAGHFDISTWIASVLYGGVAEEVLMRLFLMSALSMLARKLFFKNREAVPTGVFIVSNIIAALLFAAGHLPSTYLIFGSLSPLSIFRCFLLNGAFGLIFGRLYRKFGIQYAMLAHILLHLVSRTIWLIAF